MYELALKFLINYVVLLNILNKIKRDFVTHFKNVCVGFKIP